MFASLSIPNFRAYVLGTTLSLGARWLQVVTVQWLVYDLTSSGTTLGLVTLLRAAASLAMLPFAGTLIDRLDRRRLLIAVNVWQGIATAIVAALILAGYREAWYLFLFAFVGGLAESVDFPLRTTLVFSLVPRDLAPNAMALVQLGWSVTRLTVPALAGFLIVLLGPGGNFTIQACAYGLIILNALRIAFPPHVPNPHAAAPFLRNLQAAIAYVVHEPRTRAYILLGTVLPLLIIPVFSTLPPIFTVRVFHAGPEVLGILLAGLGAGGIIGGFAAAWLTRRERTGFIQLAALTLVGVALGGFAWSPSVPPAFAMFTVAGFGEVIFLTTNQTALQLSIPDHMRGRVSGLTQLSFLLMPVGGFLGGAGADLLGPEVITTLLAAGSIAVGLAVFAFSRTIREYRLSEALRRSERESAATP